MTGDKGETGYGPKYEFREGRVAIKDEFFPHQAEDGGSHVAFFDERSQASFVWDGVSETIQVCIGGYGEPVDHTIPAPFGGGDNMLTGRTFRAVMEQFARLCATHAGTLEKA